MLTLLQLAVDLAPQVGSAVINATPPPQEQEIRIFDLLIKGGWVMIPIVLLSLIGMYIFIERLIVIRRATRYRNGDLLRQIKRHVEEGKLDLAISICQSNSNLPIARMLLKGLAKVGKPIKEIENVIENVGRLEVSKLEKNLGILGIVAGIAPMFGFLGTISGVIKIFYRISLENNINIGTISAGLYEKMITSAAGLLVGILAYIGYHMLVMMIERITLSIETEAIDFIDMLEEPAR